MQGKRYIGGLTPPAHNAHFTAFCPSGDDIILRELAFTALTAALCFPQKSARMDSVRKENVTKMPTYEYQCGSCGHEFEEFQSIKDAPLKKCPQCSKNKLRRLISGGGGVVFKGSGFYQTDYRSEAYKSAVKAETPSAKKEPAKKESAPHSSACSCCRAAKQCKSGPS
ncbi:MAG: zinc ribbon domain-containing protein [Planctomycetaceae bacterium]|jgi:putative FmdB family regulatory protein|nr:zinc ribbon domain-containing protein [Planctomycetaceae bacterium]